MTTALDLRTRMAIHEAGQAVARHRLGLPALGVTIVPDLAQGEDDASGATRSDVDTDSAAAQVLALLCGDAAERVAKVGKASHAADPAGGDDLEQAIAVIELWGLADDMGVWKAKATRLMREARNVKAVQALAECLLARDGIEADMIPWLIEHADGECSDLQMLGPLQHYGWFSLPKGMKTATSEEIAQMVRVAIWRRVN